MADYHPERNRLTIKLVYYGPALAGKTTNLVRLHDLLAPGLIGDMMTLDTEGDRTLFFDLLPVGFVAPSGLLVKFKIYTVPGQVVHDAVRKNVLSRADGVIFVADSQCAQSVNNGASFDNLLTNVAQLGMRPERLPLVVQFNKRDLPDILSEQEIARRWGGTPWPLQLASALEGRGVVETFSTLVGLVYAELDTQFALGATHGLERAAFVSAAGGRP